MGVALLVVVVVQVVGVVAAVAFAKALLRWTWEAWVAFPWCFGVLVDPFVAAVAVGAHRALS